MTGLSHCYPVRVYYEDSDAGGVVYHANYLKFMERARTEFLRTGGFEQDELDARHGILFAVAEANIRYLRPARFNEQLQVESRIVEASGVQVTFAQQVRRIGDGELLVEGSVRVACMDRAGKPRRMPADISRFFHQHLDIPKENS
ncbi:MAG TPA: tol-pal system-associated acyl-CoA thioesterase [Mariprofundaceae bacterium]|nr:tol-pal system-associated acyl-CoA thioesterase [Mariprofundaceae bacterium]